MRKLLCILICMLVCLSSFLIIPNELKVEASGGSGGGGNGSVGLDKDFVWMVLKDLCNVTYFADWEKENGIIKGRSWGTEGENYTIDNILMRYMDGQNWCNLTSVHNLSIGYLDDFPERAYSSKVVTDDFQLIVNNASDNQYPYSRYVPKNESYPNPSAWSHWDTNDINCSHIFDHTEIRLLDFRERWPLAGTFNDYFKNISCENCETMYDGKLVLGNVTYIESEESLPAEQEGRIFLIEEDGECEDKLANVTNAMGAILIYDNAIRSPADTSSYTFSIARVSVGANNLTQVKQMLEDGMAMIVDNTVNDEILTFTYNLSEGWWPSNKHVYIDEIPTPDQMKPNYYLGYVYSALAFLRFINPYRPFQECLGAILYDYNDGTYGYNQTHIMGTTVKDWEDVYHILFINNIPRDFPALPVISVNNSVGQWLYDNRVDTTISGYINQTYKKQTSSSPGVISHNVVGYRNTTCSPDDSIVIISNRFDSMWGQCPGDSGVGGAIVLGIAKYLNDYNITPKYNLTFLMTTGEEYGCRGAFHYRDDHLDDNIIAFLGFDQLAFNQSDTNLSISFGDKDYHWSKSIFRNIVLAIVDETNYDSRTDYSFEPGDLGGESGGEDIVWRKRCNALCFCKGPDRKWHGWHRAGMNYEEGDALKYIDRNDLNVTFELAWNITKYFIVNPDCWFSNVKYEAFDSPKDGDTLDDSIRANFTINTTIPHDLVGVEPILTYYFEGEPYEFSLGCIDYIVTSPSSNHSYTFQIPDIYSYGDFQLHFRVSNSTGRINNIIYETTSYYNDTSVLSDIYHLYHPFGCITKGDSSKSVHDQIRGSVFTANENGYADNITAYINLNFMSPGPYKCILYRANDSKLIGNTTENWTRRDVGENPYSTSDWAVFNFSEPKPVLKQGTQYVITCWGDSAYSLLYCNDFSYPRGRIDDETYGTPPQYADFTNESRLYSIYCSYTAINYGPKITSVTSDPDTVGFGFDVTISANVTDVDGVDMVKVNIGKPDTEPGAISSYTMTNTEGSIYEYVFNDTWENGQYNYTIWGIDDKGYSNTSSLYSFNVSAMATVSVCTVKDEYGNNTIVNITDPPSNPPQIGYELLDNSKVLKIWNKYDSYYFNTSSGIQLTNHYNDYWSHNVLMLGYYNNDQWNLIYRTDELSGFNKDIESDDETYVNVTLWKDLTYGGYDFRLAIRYHLGVNDNELTVIPYIKNLGQPIPYNLGFAWEINNIQICMTPENDYIEINGTTHILNETLDETYKNMAIPSFYIREDVTDDKSESLYLRWNNSLDYRVKVKSRDGEYNAPVTIAFKIGNLAAGQEKYTKMFWHDLSEIVYYFNSFYYGETWSTNPAYMVDGSISNYASTSTNNDVELCDGNTCTGTNLGNIAKAELRVYGYYSSAQRDTILRPVFDGTTDGLDYHHTTEPSPSWSRWFDITNDPYAGPCWNWNTVADLDCDVEAGFGYAPLFTLYASKVELRVTYTPNNNPIISDPYPSDESTGIGISPMLNITVSDPDGDNMNITWLSNSSGSWQVFGTNNSVSNGTYHQIFSNASVNGEWWYWKVNVTDGINSAESNVYKFYTGYESKIKNTGSTNIKGYILMQVHFFDGQTWIVALNCADETTPRTINIGEQFALDTVFNGKVNTADLIKDFDTGLYRVYACFRDPDGNVLVCDDETELEATYEFTITFE